MSSCTSPDAETAKFVRNTKISLKNSYTCVTTLYESSPCSITSQHIIPTPSHCQQASSTELRALSSTALSDFDPQNPSKPLSHRSSGTSEFPSPLYHATQSFGQGYLHIGGQGFGASRGLQSHRSVSLRDMPTPTPMTSHPSVDLYMASMDVDNTGRYAEYNGGRYLPPSPVTSFAALRRRDPTFPTDEETERYLRKTLSIPPTMPVNLWALPDEPFAGRAPKISDQIKLAIWGNPAHKLTLRQIYEAVERRYPLRIMDPDKAWQRSIRHSLSLKAIFIRLDRPQNDPGKGHYWALDIRDGDVNQRDRRRRTMEEQGPYDEDADTDFSSESQAGSPTPFPFSGHGSYHRADLSPGYVQQPYVDNDASFIAQSQQGVMCNERAGLYPYAMDTTDVPLHNGTYLSDSHLPWLPSPPLNHPTAIFATPAHGFQDHQQQSSPLHIPIMDVGTPHPSSSRQPYITPPEIEEDEMYRINALRQYPGRR